MELRTFIDCLSAAGRLQRVGHPMDWKLEIGEWVRQHRSPVLFENIKDYPGARIFANGLSSMAAVGLAVGLPSGANRGQVLRELKRRGSYRLKPALVADGPVLENICTAEDVDLLKFAVPHWNPLDRGRYIGTWHVNVSKDPDTDVRNVGVYRMELLGPRQATVNASSGSHLGMHAAKAERQGKALEMAMVIGATEALVMAASAACPYGVDEYDLAGGIQQESIPLVACRTIGLEVPADAEIVIEGVIKPGIRVQDGPYLDYLGKPSTNPRALLFEATAVLSRHNPIFRGASIGVPGAEDQYLFAALASMGLWDFHNSRAKRWLQSNFLQREWFRAFLLAGRLHLH